MENIFTIMKGVIILKGQSNIMKIICCFLTVVIITSMITSNTYATTQGQKSIEDIGVDITWYDFGDNYKDYYIQREVGADFYKIAMTNASNEIYKTAFINGKGEVILQPDNYGRGSSYDWNDSTIVVKKDDAYNIINSKGISIIDGKDYSEIVPSDNGYATVTLKSNSHKGVIDKKGNLIFEDKEGKYKDFRFMGDGVFSAEINENAYDLLDVNGSLLTKTSYSWIVGINEEIIRVVSLNNKYGFLDLSGTEIISPIYDDTFLFYEGLAAICKNKKWGFIDNTGKEIISPRFDYVHSFENGLAAVSLNKKWGLIDKEGNIVLPIEYDNAPKYEKDFFIVNKDNKSIMINSSGEAVSTKEYSYFNIGSSKNIYVEKVLNGATVSAYLDKNENMLTGFKEFSLQYLSDQLYLGQKSGEYPPGVVPPHDYQQRFTLLDSQGNNLTGFKYENVGDFFNDFQVVYKYYYNCVGLVNQNGAEVLPTIFDDILLTDEGYAIVSISDHETGRNSRVGYFKIPNSFADIKNTKPITVYLNGTELYFDSEPTISNQRTMVPMRKIFESLGASVDWDNSTRTATASITDKKLNVTIGSDVAYVNGSKIQLEVAPFIQGGITLVPLRFVSENLGADVKWDGDLRRVIITSNK